MCIAAKIVMRDFCAAPNIRFCSIKDFRELCHAAGAKMEQAVAPNAWADACG